MSRPSPSTATAHPAHPAHFRLLHKQRELAAFQLVLHNNRALAHHLDRFADTFDHLDAGSDAVADVVEHWQTVFRITHLALASLATKADPDTGVPRPGTLPDRLVRIPVASSDADDPARPHHDPTRSAAE